MKKLVIIIFIGVFVLHLVNINLNPLFMSDDSCVFFPPSEGCSDGGTATASDYDGLAKTKYSPYSIGGL